MTDRIKDIVERLLHLSQGIYYVNASTSVVGARDIAAEAASTIEDLAAALTGMLKVYTSIANSGDAGFWDPEEEPEVIAARAALSKARGET